VKQEWIDRPEGGSEIGLRLLLNFALLCGRTAARLVLYPITAYFLIRRGPERRASRQYLRRVLQRRATLSDVARHIHAFASVTLDRVFLLAERFKRFEPQVHGIDELRNAWQENRGVLVFGAHICSFDALRVLAERRSDLKMRVVLDVEHNPRVTHMLRALNPKIADAVINARQDGTSTALAIKEALDEGALVTLLVDRARPGNAVQTADFLGSPAPFPTAPWLLAAAVKVPVVLCFGLYRGGNRYDLHFELFAHTLSIERANREAALKAIVQRYADRLAHHARSAPYNWFNFYDFWQLQDSAADPAMRPDAGARDSAGGAVRRA
jgi:predicted LPLAT superfamily acyltransferase